MAKNNLQKNENISGKIKIWYHFFLNTVYEVSRFSNKFNVKVIGNRRKEKWLNFNYFYDFVSYSWPPCSKIVLYMTTDQVILFIRGAISFCVQYMYGVAFNYSPTLIRGFVIFTYLTNKIVEYSNITKLELKWDRN